MKEKRIEKEILRLSKFFAAAPAGKRQLAEGLIRRAAYMRVTLEDFEVDLDTNGHVELFSQSEKLEPYERERPAARLYNSMIRNYQTLMKQLVDLLPANASNEIKNEIKEFM